MTPPLEQLKEEIAKTVTTEVITIEPIEPTNSKYAFRIVNTEGVVEAIIRDVIKFIQSNTPPRKEEGGPGLHGTLVVTSYNKAIDDFLEALGLEVKQ